MLRNILLRFQGRFFALLNYLKISHGTEIKKQKSGACSYAKAQGDRRTRLSETTNLEHLHIELLKQGERIEQLRADLNKKNQGGFSCRSLLSSVETNLACAIDAYGGPMRRMRNNMCKLKQTTRALCGCYDAYDLSSSSSDNENDGKCEDETGEREDDEEDGDFPQRRCQKLGSHK